MARIIRVRYEEGVLKPLDELKLKEGDEVVIVIRSFQNFSKTFKDIVIESERDPLEILISQRG